MRRVCLWCVLALAVALAGAPAVRSEPQPAPLTAPDLEAFFGDLLPAALDRDDIAGAEVVIVRRGEILFAKGYGYADVAARTPMSPSRSIIRQASISKLFTWTAVMQLVEEGRLDLDRDVNAYLDFKIPPYRGRPLTLRDILTIRSGFEEVINTLRPPGELTLEQYVKRYRPQRIYAPGEVVAYSNYAAMLAGYIVQRVSGQRFEDYVAQRILAPLGMTRSTFEQRPPAHLSALLAKGYTTASAAAPYPPERGPGTPSGGLFATGEDIGRFMIAHLQDGALGQARILRPETARWMHSRQRRAAPEVNGVALGFYEEDRNGRRIIGHAGGSVVFRTDLHLLPDEGVGFYIAFNSAGRGGAADALQRRVFQAFLDRYYPRLAPPASALTGEAQRQAFGLGGFYQSTRHAVSSLQLMRPLMQARVEEGADGGLTVSAFRDGDGEALRWIRMSDSVWRSADGRANLAFLPRRAGAPATFAADALAPTVLYQQVGGLRRADRLWTAVQGGAWTAAAAALLALAAAAWPRRLAGPRWLALAAALGASAQLAVLVLWPAYVRSVMADDALLIATLIDPRLKLLAALGVLAIAATAPVLALAIRLALRRDHWRLRWTAALAMTAATIFTVWFVISYRLFSAS